MRSINLYTAICINLRLLTSGSVAFTSSSYSTPKSTRGIKSSSSSATSNGRRTKTITYVGSIVETTTTTPSYEAASSFNNDRDGDNVPSSSSSSSSSSPSSPPASPNWESKQHLYGADMLTSRIDDDDSSSSSSRRTAASITLDADGEVAVDGGGGADGESSLPLPQTYVTCGKCNSLFALAEEDLGRGKGCRVKCGVCSHTWYQSRDRLFDIPTDTHDMIPANKSDLDRIARNLARDVSPSFTGVFKLYVGNLDFRTTPEQLLEFFENGSDSVNAKGSVCDVSMVKGPDGRSRGFAFVTFYDEEDGRAALSCNGMECNGRLLSVKEPNN